jgi:hypothetical protein
MTMLLTERWPQRTAEAADSAAGDSAPGDNAAGDGASGNGGTAQELLAEMAVLIRDTRPYLIVSAVVAAAVLIGLAVESTTLPVGRPGPGAVAVTALFAAVALCLLRTLALIVLAGLPLGHVLSQQRVSAGAPLDPRAPWASVPAPEATSRALGLGPGPPAAQPGPFPGGPDPGRHQLGPHHHRRLPGLHSHHAPGPVIAGTTGPGPRPDPSQSVHGIVAGRAGSHGGDKGSCAVPH